ncbi:MAG TPA: hypothetical protein VET27_12260 [Mycobacterium sp.]|nr:hypothetical protein [Mycobacterium sp.]
MWIVEINVLGRRFTHTVGDRPDPSLRTPRMTQWRHWKQRHPRAAA